MNRNELIEKLKAEAFTPDGWLSDAQQANLEWIGDWDGIYFNGTGGIDVGALVDSIVEACAHELTLKSRLVDPVEHLVDALGELMNALTDDAATDQEDPA